MTGRYAAQTTVSPERSRMEIERSLTRYGAKEFGYMTSAVAPPKAFITFKVHNRIVRLAIPLPDMDEFKFFPKKGKYDLYPKRRTDLQHQKAYDQAVRSRWRATALIIKAKLEAIDAGISTLEREFMPDIVLNSGRTLGEVVEPQLEEITTGFKLLQLTGRE